MRCAHISGTEYLVILHHIIYSGTCYLFVEKKTVVSTFYFLLGCVLRCAVVRTLLYTRTLRSFFLLYAVKSTVRPNCLWNMAQSQRMFFSSSKATSHKNGPPAGRLQRGSLTSRRGGGGHAVTGLGFGEIVHWSGPVEWHVTQPAMLPGSSPRFRCFFIFFYSCSNGYTT